MQSGDEKAQRRTQRIQHIEEERVRGRWRWTILLSFNLLFTVSEIWEKRSQWPSLLSLHALTQFRNFSSLVSSLEWNVFCLLLWSYLLVETWVIVGRHQHEQARQEQERQIRTSASAEGVWPPKPTPPAA